MRTFAVVSVLAMYLFLASCSNEQKSSSDAPLLNVPGTVSSSESAPPRVTAAEILPAGPTARTPLTLAYTGQDGEGGPVQYAYRWYVDGSDVEEGVGSALEPGSYKKGSEVYAEIIPSDARTQGPPFRTKTIVIANQPPEVAAVNMTPVPAFAGSMIKAEPDAVDPDGDEISIAYQWKANGAPVAAAGTQASLDTRDMKKNDIISVFVRASDGEGTVDAESGGLRLSNSSPKITSSPPSGLVQGRYDYKVAAVDADGDRLAFSLLSGPPGMSINPSTGMVTWQAPGNVTGQSNVSVQIAVDDGDGGRAIQEFSLVMEMK
jgi:hypothetical protein